MGKSSKNWHLGIPNAQISSFGEVLGTFLGSLGVSWAALVRLGRALGASWCVRRRFGGALMRLGGVLGPSWEDLGRVLGESWRVSGSILGAFFDDFLSS